MVLQRPWTELWPVYWKPPITTQDNSYLCLSRKYQIRLRTIGGPTIVFAILVKKWSHPIANEKRRDYRTTFLKFYSWIKIWILEYIFMPSSCVKNISALEPNFKTVVLNFFHSSRLYRIRDYYKANQTKILGLLTFVAIPAIFCSKIWLPFFLRTFVRWKFDSF